MSVKAGHPKTMRSKIGAQFVFKYQRKSLL